MNSLSRFSAIIFDMDGLLLDTERISLDTFNEACSLLALGDLSHIFTLMIGVNSESGATILKNGLQGLVEYEIFINEWMQLYKNETDLKPLPVKSGAKSLLAYISNMGIPMAVATSTKTKSAEQILDVSGISHYFDFIVGGDKVSKSKPFPDIYLQAADSLSVESSTCLAVEDSSNGVKAAIAADMTVIQIPDLVQPDKELLALGHIVLENLNDIQNYRFF